MNSKGFSLVELLVGMAIFGVLMVTVSFFFVSNQKIATEQLGAVDLENSLGLTEIRLKEVIAQAHYIYPAGQTIDLKAANGTSLSFTTGEDALAILIPEDAENSSYCTGAEQEYCGYIFTLEDRTKAEFALMLKDSGDAAGFALIETQVQDISWPSDQLPSKNWVKAARSRAPLADYIDADKTFLTDLNKLNSAKKTSLDERVFDLAASYDSANALIKDAPITLALKLDFRGKELTRERFVFVNTRCITSAALPNPN